MTNISSLFSTYLMSRFDICAINSTTASSSEEDLEHIYATEFDITLGWKPLSHSGEQRENGKGFGIHI